MTERFARLGTLARKGLANPQKVPPYLWERTVDAAYTPARRLATAAATAGLPDQRAELATLRQHDSWLLIVLDACRFDEFCQWAPNHVDADIHAMRAAGRDTFEYAMECWHRDQPPHPGDPHDVTYVSGATPINSVDLDYEEKGLEHLYHGFTPRTHIGEIVDAWDTAWDTALGTAPPEGVARVARDHLDADQLVVHFFQPHAPHIGSARELGHTSGDGAQPFAGEPVDGPVWQRVYSGEVSDARLRRAYQSNLCRTLRVVAALIEAVPHDQIRIIGDHGEALGEYNTYAHPRVEHPHIRRVPMADVHAAIDAPDLGEVTTAGGSGADEDVAARLEALGYA